MRVGRACSGGCDTQHNESIGHQICSRPSQPARHVNATVKPKFKSMQLAYTIALFLGFLNFSKKRKQAKGATVPVTCR